MTFSSNKSPNQRQFPADEQLARQAQGGCVDSFGELVERYSQRLYHFLHYRTASSHDAEDLAQETFIRALENMHRYNANRKFSTWLFTIAVRLTINYHRDQRRRKDRDSKVKRYYQDIMVSGERQNEALADTCPNIWTYVRQLPPNQYHALWLRYVENMAVADIAQALSKTRVHTRVLLHRGRKNLAEKLKKEAKIALSVNFPEIEEPAELAELVSY